MTSILRVLLPGVLLVTLVACGNDDDSVEPGAPDNGSDDAPPAEDATPPADADDNDVAPPSGNDGDGTLTVDGVTFTFEILECGLDPATRMDNVSFGLTGRGETPDGEQFMVDVTGAELSEGMDSQSISLRIGDAGAPAMQYENLRLRMGDAITGTGDMSISESELEWPLFEFDGGVVTAEAGFTVDGEGIDDIEHVGLGVLEANCG